MKKALKIILSLIIALVVVAGAYVAYVFLTYDRIEDNQAVDVDNAASVASSVDTGKEMSITSWNIGFGAYVQDYSFFMDGGKESRARSKELLLQNMDDIGATLEKFNSDFYVIQEVDVNGTRTWHTDESKILRERFGKMSCAFAQNYDSAYLFYPFTEPHGANKSGIMTLASSRMTSSLRRSLPIQNDFHKILDLDRCFDVTRLPADNGRELVLINTHLSAYTTDPQVNVDQLNMIYDVMTEEYKAGNYVICGGDFNKDLLGDSTKMFDEGDSKADANWCQPFPVDTIPDHVKLVSAYDKAAKVPTCRNADIPYVKGETFVCTIDGFLVTDNVEVKDAEVRDEEFKCSDHNPVTMRFVLKKTK